MRSPFESFSALCKDVKEKFELENLRVTDSKKKIKTIAFCTGSGSELLDDLDIDCFITGDLKYHTALQSLENRISLIDINHFESERYFGLSLAPFLQKFKSQVIISNSKNPFQYI